MKRKPTHDRTRPGHRLIVLLGALTLLLSLTAQIIDVQSVSAQQRLQADDEEQNGEQVEPVLEPSYVFIDKFDCPPGSDWSQASYDQLSGNCGPNQSPVNMTVGGETKSVGASAQWGPYDGPANIDISEEERQGYGPPRFTAAPIFPIRPLQVSTIWGPPAPQVGHLQLENLSTARSTTISSENKSDG